MWDLPGPGIEPVSPALVGGFLTTAPAGKPGKCVLTLETAKLFLKMFVPKFAFPLTMVLHPCQIVFFKSHSDMYVGIPCVLIYICLMTKDIEPLMCLFAIPISLVKHLFQFFPHFFKLSYCLLSCTSF